MKNNTTTATANKNLTSPMNEIAKETWAELLNTGFQSVPDEQLPNLLQIIGHDSAFGYRYIVDNEDSEDNGEPCTVYSAPSTVYDSTIQLLIVDDKFDKDIQYLQLKNYDTKNDVIFSYPIQEIGDFIFEVEDDSIEIHFRYRNLSIYLELCGLDVDDDD